MDLLKLIVSDTPKNPFMVTIMQTEGFFDFKQVAEMSLIIKDLQFLYVHTNQKLRKTILIFSWTFSYSGTAHGKINIGVILSPI